MPTSATIEIPMATGDDGVIRVSGTRVTLDSILLAFNDGASAEEIAGQYPVVPLADIYYLIGYCLRHAGEMEEYLGRRRRESLEVRQQNEARWLAEENLNKGIVRGLLRRIGDILLLSECSHHGEWEGQVRYLPLR
jgi:uncharacterized protein (DUF433 family)